MGEGDGAWSSVDGEGEGSLSVGTVVASPGGYSAVPSAGVPGVHWARINPPDPFNPDSGH